MASAENFNYNYAEVTGLFGKTEMAYSNKKPDFSTKGIGATVQYSPYENVYLKATISRLKINDSKKYGSQKFKTYGNSTTIAGLVGLYVPVTDNLDLLAGVGIANENDDYKYGIENTQNQFKYDERKTKFYGEAGTKIGLSSWGELDLMYSRLNDANYFTASGKFALTENWGIQTGYSYSPSGKYRKRYGSWIIGARYSF